jgi:peptide/nickel transport system permease protein
VLVRRLLRTPAGKLGSAVTLGVILVALFADALAPSNPFIFEARRFLAPSRAHLMGTDQLGRDMLSAVVLGVRTSMTVVAWVLVISALVGIVLGAVAGYRKGLVDDLVMRLAETIQSVPRFFLAILAAGWFGASLRGLIVVLGLTSWPFLARVVRAETLSLGSREFVDAARSMGASEARLLFRHIIPNVLPSAAVVSALTASRVILLEASLAFLGLGDPEVMSLGFLINSAQGFLDRAWWISVFPGGAIMLAVLGLNLLSDALNDVLNPLTEQPRAVPRIVKPG